MTRRRIVEAAAASFRQHGLKGIGIAEVMKQAGLTHGGFYAHFSSKDELIAEVMAMVRAQVFARYAAAAASVTQDEKLIAIAESYLTSGHREHPERGCMVVTLGSEVVREGGRAQSELSHHIQAMLDHFAEMAPEGGDAERRRNATGVYAAMVGGLLLARSVEDPNQADDILASVRHFLRDTLVPQ